MKFIVELHLVTLWRSDFPHWYGYHGDRVGNYLPIPQCGCLDCLTLLKKDSHIGRFGLYTYCGKVTFLDGLVPGSCQNGKALVEPIQSEYWGTIRKGDFLDAYELTTMVAHGKVLEVQR